MTGVQHIDLITQFLVWIVHAVSPSRAYKYGVYWTGRQCCTMRNILLWCGRIFCKPFRDCKDCEIKKASWRLVWLAREIISLQFIYLFYLFLRTKWSFSKLQMKCPIKFKEQSNYRMNRTYNYTYYNLIVPYEHQCEWLYKIIML